METAPASAPEAVLSDTALAMQVVEGNLAAFETVMRQCNRKLFRIARGVLREALSNCRFKKRVSSICEGDTPSIASIHFSAAQSSITHCMGIDSADYPPRLELLHHLVPIMACPHQVPPTPEMIRHLPMRGQKSLRMFHRLEPSHLTFPFPSWLMRVLRPIIESSAAAVFDCREDVTMGGHVA